MYRPTHSSRCVSQQCTLFHRNFSCLISVGFSPFLQLERTHDVHLSLEEKFSQGREDSAQLLKQHELLLEQLDQEAKLKSQLQLELHKTEGEHCNLIDLASLDLSYDDKFQ